MHNALFIKIMDFNYPAIIVSAILAIIVAAIYYGPIFGNLWLKVIGADVKDLKARKKMQKQAMPLYVISVVLTLFQVWVLAWYLAALPGYAGWVHSLWIWGGFVIPTLAATIMWTNKSNKIKITQFLLQAGYQLIIFIMFGLILQYWK